MTSRWEKDQACADCGKRKGPKQAAKKRCFTCQRIADKKASQEAHAGYILRTYGITSGEYYALLAFQAGKCAICARATGRTRRLAVDHNHSCAAGHPSKVGCAECVRGLLCSVCNTFIGRIRDDPRVADRMGRYLREPPYVALKAGQGSPILVRRLRVDVPAVPE